MSTQRLTSYQHGVASTLLYNPQCMLDINPEVARMYLVLLSADPSDASASTLPFVALTDGNIVDACMGAHPQHREGAHYRAAREAKAALAVVAEDNDAIKDLAIGTYKQGFNIVLDYNGRVKKTFFLIRCCIHGRMRRKALKDLKDNFAMLEEVVATNQ